MLDSAFIWAVIAAALGVVVVRKSVIIVRQGYEYTLVRFGRFSTTLRPGFHLIVQFVNRVGHKVNMMERVLDVPSQEVISKDNAVLTVDGVVFFQVLDAPKAAVEALSDFATGPNAKTLLLPVEATGILSSLAGITEVAREAFDKTGKQP